MFEGFMDTKLPTLDFRETDSKDIRGYLPQGVMADEIMCEIQNTTSFLDSRGKWVAVPNISDVLLPRVHDGHGAIRLYLSLNVRDVVFLSYLLKLI